MDIKHELITNYGKPGVTEIAKFIGDSPKRFSTLMEIFYGPDKRLSQRAAWPMSDVALKAPNLLLPYLPEMISKLGEPKVHDAIKRNILRSIQTYDLPEELCGEAFEHCLNILLNPKEAIALRAFSITTVTTICKQYPELKTEVLQAIDIITDEDNTPAIYVRCRDSRKTLSKL